MPVATQVEAHHRLEYANSVTMVAQQTKVLILDAINTIPATGEAQSATDIVNQVEGIYAEERGRVNPENPISGARRWLMRTTRIHSGQTIDREDKFDVARDPTSDFVRAHTLAVLRMRQDKIIGVKKNLSTGGYEVSSGGILGDAIDGKRPSSTGTALPGSQIIAVGGTGLTLDKLRTAVLTLQQADFGIEDDDPLYALISPKQQDDLLAIAAASTTPLNAFNIEQLKSGKPTMLMGINWIVSNRVPKDVSGNWLVPVWSKRNIVEGIWEPLQGDMWNLPSAMNLPYVYAWMRSDVTRVQDKGVIAITCTP